MPIKTTGNPLGGASARAVTTIISGSLTGVVYTLPRLLGSSSTIALLSGSNSNLTLSGSAISATVALGNGSSQKAIVRETLGDLAVEYPITILTPAIAPAAPTVSISNVGSGQISLSFIDNAANGSPITSHNVYRGTIAGSTTLLGNLATSSPFIDTGLTNGTTYYYRISAVNAIGEGAKSTEISVTPSAAMLRSIGRTSPITTANGGNSQAVLVNATTDRQNLVIRNPADSPGSIRIGTKTGTENLLLDTYSLGTLVTTLAPGEEWYDTAGQQAYLAQSADTTVPANLSAEVYYEHPPVGGALPTATTGKRAATVSSIKRHFMKNVTYTTGAPMKLLKDGVTYLRANGLVLQKSTNLTTSSTPVWTTVFTFPNAAGTQITGVLELSNGEIIVGTASYNLTGFIYRSSGWSTNQSIVTFTQVFTSSNNPAFAADYSLTPFNAATNGVIVIGESGPQTAGGSANDTADSAKPTSSYMSADFGSTWRKIFDLRTFATSMGVQYPAGVHLHGVSYDPEWDRVWIAYGDANGDGKIIAGAGYVQVVYADDAKLKFDANQTLTWTKLPAFPNYDNTGQYALPQTGQFIKVAFNSNSVIFTPDVTKPFNGLYVMRKNGYRQLAPAEFIQGGFGLRGEVTYAGGTYFCPGLAGNSSPAGTYRTDFFATNDMLSWGQVSISQTLTSSASLGIQRILGPDNNGKIVAVFGAGDASMSGGGTAIGDFSYEDVTVPKVYVPSSISSGLPTEQPNTTSFVAS